MRKVDKCLFFFYQLSSWLYIHFFSVLTNIPLSWKRTHARPNLILPRSFSLVRPLSLSLYLSVFLSLPRNQSCSSLVCHHCHCWSNIPLSEFLLVSLNHTNLLGQSFFLFLSLQPHQSLQDQSCFSLLLSLCHHHRCQSKITLSKFLLISLVTITPTFLIEASSSFSLNNHTNLFFKSKEI